ncbi:MAG: M14 family zinc carboxypeptidase [Firmicutes bacterium]|nr:hypothetical protein [Lachnospiraceae bacterium]MDD6066678.1 M14 family zinc carboxypeptidase [Bacillota bacterium]MDY2820216.1 M14 family zinc carboxypeptidase [Hominisplanchenecus sp.]
MPETGREMRSVQAQLRYYHFEEWEECLKSVCEQYPQWLRLFQTGKSQDGRVIYEVQLGNHPRCVICAAGVHGREWLNPVLLLFMIEEYAKAAQQGRMLDGYDVADMLNYSSICFVPLVNPDGYVIANEGFDAIRNPYYRHTARLRCVSFVYWKANARGIDINRNFPGKSWFAGNGPWPASESETRTLVQVFCSHPQSLGFLDFHSRGRVLYYYRKGMGLSYNRMGRKLAAELSGECGYRLASPSEEFLTGKDGGNSVHYYAEYFRRPAITVETLDEKLCFPLSEKELQDTYQEIRTLPLALIRFFVEK